MTTDWKLYAKIIAALPAPGTTSTALKPSPKAKVVRAPRAPVSYVYSREIPLVEMNKSERSNEHGVGTLGLNGCAGLAYVHGANAAMAHLTAELPGQNVDGMTMNGQRRVSWHTQLTQFTAKMTEAGLSGTEQGGQWYFAYPVNSDGSPLAWSAHGATLGWVQATFRVTANAKSFLTWTQQEEADPSATSRTGRGSMVVLQGRAYLENVQM